MAENNERQNRNRKVIPYDQAFGVQNAGLTEPDKEEKVQSDTGDANTLQNRPYPLGLRNLEPEDTEQTDESTSLNAADSIGRDDRSPDNRPLESGDDEEFAREVAHWGPVIGGEKEDEGEENKETAQAGEGNGWGVTGLILSLVSLFLLPALLAPAGMIAGFIAYRREARTMGIWAMAIGAFALLMALFVLPTYFR